MRRAQPAFWSATSWVALSFLASACPDNTPAPLDVGRVHDAAADTAAAMDAPSEDAPVAVLDSAVLDAASAVDALDTSTPSDAGADAARDAALPVDAPRDASFDAPSDVGTDAARLGFGPSQCSGSVSCSAGNFCTNRAPGGVCSCFPGAEICPSGTTCDIDLGACIRDCTSDLDCVLGMACVRLTGRCSLRNCDATTPCPSPYLCATGRCFRPECGAGEPCPAGWSCDGEYCVEP